MTSQVQKPSRLEAEELCTLAESLSERRLFSNAITAIERAIALCPDSPSLWSNLAAHLWSARLYDAAEKAAKKAIELDPDYLYAWANLGLIKQCQWNYKEALACFNTVLQKDPKNYRAIWNRGLLHLSSFVYKQGWEDYEARILHEGDSVYEELPSPIWDGEAELLSKNLFISGEQGIGDSILMSRFLPWISEKVGPYGCIYISYPDIVARLLWYVQSLRNVVLIPEGVPLPRSHYSLHMASLPHRYGCTLENLPFDPGFVKMRVDTQANSQPVVVPSPPGERPFRVGICWSGNPSQERNQDRRISLDLLFQLASHPRVWLYSLQCGEAEQDIARSGLEGWIVNPVEDLVREGLAGTGTAMQQLDLVITCCTSIAHLAGALDLPAWVLLPEDPHWVWGRNHYKNSVWWPSLRLFRQEKPFEWQPVINQVKEELNILIGSH